ncbi:hypothetical protein HMPREF0981_00215 [Erysipelotrichaceae bacterium 6_1_45]|nr:hypothetical protein HMPREF0981_00215 [Erysipelotrichaceae bacterium 6_1_45]
MDLDKQIDMLVCTDNKKAYNALTLNFVSNFRLSA